jgi:Zn-dependent oligopeptidase
MRNATEFVDEIAGRKNSNYRNTIASLAKFESDQATVSAIIDFYSSVSPNKEMREMSTKMSQIYSHFINKLYLREDFYQALIDYRTKANSIESEWDWEKLEPVQQRFVNKVIHSMERDGLKLPADKREKVRKLEAKISELETKAMTYIGEDTTKVDAPLEKLDGLTDDILKSLEDVKDSKDHHKYISMKPNEIQQAMRLIKDPEERRLLATAKDSLV